MARQLVDALVAQAGSDPSLDLTSPAALAIMTADPPTRAEAVALLATELKGGMMGGFLGRQEKTTTKAPVLRRMLASLLEGNLPLTEAQLVALVWASWEGLPMDRLLHHVERYACLHGLPREAEEPLDELERQVPRAAAALRAVRRWLRDFPAGVVDPDTWGRALGAWMTELDDATQGPWIALLRHCNGASTAVQPSTTWSRRAGQLVSEVGPRPFAARLEDWLGGLDRTRPLRSFWADRREGGLTARNQEVLRCLLWSAGGVADTRLAHVIARFAERCFEKVPGVGPASSRLGNACVQALGAMPDGAGVAQLSGLTSKVRYASGRQRLDTALDAAASRLGKDREDLEELAVPELALDPSGRRQVRLGDFTAELSIADGTGKLRWLRPDGRAQVSVPKAVRESHSGELEALKGQVRELGALLVGQAAKLERLWLSERRLPLEALRRRYVGHPVVGHLGRRLMWLVQVGGVRHELLWQDGRLALVGGGELPELPAKAEARLWHPLDAPSPEAILVWRDLVDSLQLTQPFPQLWREVYRPAPGATDEDSRFAGHLVRQLPLVTLCRQRGWRYTPRGYWASRNIPTLLLPHWGLSATVAVEPAQHARDQAIVNYLRVGGVRFFEAGEEHSGAAPLPLADVPPIVFSEVLRDVDFFVGSTTVANDANFRESQLGGRAREAWQALTWGELGPVVKARAELIERVLSRTILRDRARVEERWVVVDGATERFRIHLGTMAVVRERDQQPVLVAVDRQTREQAARAFLPFEGDSLLGCLLAKAFLLAGDGAASQA